MKSFPAFVVCALSGSDAKPDGGIDLTNYKMHFMPITFPTKPLKHKDLTYAGGK